jgi:hypothetical protein
MNTGVEAFPEHLHLICIFSVQALVFLALVPALPWLDCKLNWPSASCFPYSSVIGEFVMKDQVILVT